MHMYFHVFFQLSDLCLVVLLPRQAVLSWYSYPVMPTEQCVFLILYIHSIYSILYMYNYNLVWFYFLETWAKVYTWQWISLPYSWVRSRSPIMLSIHYSYRCFINPRRACAARVTVVVLCVCPSVCLFVYPRLFSDYRLRGGL